MMKLDGFIGQENIVKTIKIGIKAARKTKTALDHVLLYGPAGVGKTSMAKAIAEELGVKMRIVQGINIGEVNDLIGIMSVLKEGDVLFIDEIHTIKRETAEILYPALENKSLDLIIGRGINKRNIRVPLPNFTLIAATTNRGDLTNSLEDRFGYVFYMDEYTEEEMKKIVNRNNEEWELGLNDDEMGDIVNSSRGIPRNAMRILKRVRDYQLAGERASIQQIITDCGLSYWGLNDLDIRYLMSIDDQSMSLTSISHSLNVDERTIINKIEPYMYSNGWIVKNSKGRMLSEKGREIIKKIKGINE